MTDPDGCFCFGFNSLSQDDYLVVAPQNITLSGSGAPLDLALVCDSDRAPGGITVEPADVPTDTLRFGYVADGSD